MGSPECERILYAYSFVTREIANAILSAEVRELDPQDNKEVSAAIRSLEEQRSSLRRELTEHARMHVNNGREPAENNVPST